MLFVGSVIVLLLFVGSVIVLLLFVGSVIRVVPRVATAIMIDTIKPIVLRFINTNMGTYHQVLITIYAIK